ncbi:MAG TPA: enoyl-CoA hydratase/isomerase family protein [Myxococcota bacterium]
MATTISRDGDVSIVQLDEGRGNSLSFQTLAALGQALDSVQASDAHALVLTGVGKVFSAGLDLRACARYDRAQLASYVDAFEALFERVFSYPLPIVAALNGAAIAGGAVIALACDVRVMAESATLALNEVELGLPFPSMAFEIGRFGYPPAAHVDGLLLGKSFSAAEACARGIAAEVASDAVAASVVRAKEFAARDGNAIMHIKRMLRAEALARATQNAIHSRRTFVDGFFRPGAQAKINAVVARLERKNG